MATKTFNEFHDDRQPRRPDVMDGRFKLSLNDDNTVMAEGDSHTPLITLYMGSILQELATYPVPLSRGELQLMVKGHYHLVRRAIERLISSGLLQESRGDGDEPEAPTRYVLAIGQPAASEESDQDSTSG